MKTYQKSIVLAFVAALLTVVLAYSLQRAYAGFFTLEPNPALIIASPRIAMFERLWIGLYLAAMVAPLTFVVARRNLGGVLRFLSVAAPLVALVIAVQGTLVP